MCNNELIWIILIISMLGSNGDGCGCNNGCSGGNDIIPLILILMLLGNNGGGLSGLFGDGCGCNG